MSDTIDDMPLEVKVEIVDDWLVVVTATGAWEFSSVVSSEVIQPAAYDAGCDWFLLDLSSVTFGSEEMVCGIVHFLRAVEQRHGGLVIRCQGRIRRAVEIAFGGTLNVRETMVEARGLIESMRSSSGGVSRDSGGQPRRER